MLGLHASQQLKESIPLLIALEDPANHPHPETTLTQLAPKAIAWPSVLAFIAIQLPMEMTPALPALMIFALLAAVEPPVPQQLKD